MTRSPALALLLALPLLLVIAACGRDEVPSSLNDALLQREKLPKPLPRQVATTSNGRAGSFAQTLSAVENDERQGFVRALRDSGFVRGSARQFRAATGRARVLLLLQGVAEFKSADGAGAMVDRARKIGKRGERDELDLDLGDFSAAYKVKVAKTPVYTFTWQRGRLAFFLSLVSNRNGGPSQTAVERVAERAATVTL